MGAFVAVYVFVAALCVGSFLNVVIARLPAGRSIAYPGSACPRCGTPIRWYDNIPVLSWFLLRGRCRSCGLPISPRYPLVELLTAVVVLAVVHRFGVGWTALGYAAFACALIALTFIDLDTWLLPHEITWPLLAAGLASPAWNHALRPLDSLVGAAAGFVLFAGIALFGEKLLQRETMGWGDVWLLAAIGAWVGWRQLLPVVFLAAVQGAVVGALMLWRKGKRGESAGGDATAAAAPQNDPARPPADPADDDWVPPPHAVPFGPFLALAALEQLLVGQALQTAWLDALGWLWR